MNHDLRDCSTEDEGVDEDMMFEFEEELNARLSLHEGDANAAVRARTPVDGLRARSPFVGDSSASVLPSMPARPTNPVAAVLQSANDAEDAVFASLSASPFGTYGSPAAAGTLRLATAMAGSFSAPPAMVQQDKSPSFDFNGRRKRKYFDDSCCVTPRVRPLAKRAKSFSCVGEMLLPDCGFKSISSTSFVPCVVPEQKPSAMPSSTATPVAPTATPQPSAQIFSSSRSKSIQIPHRERALAAHRSAALHLQRSSSGPARGTSGYVHVSKTLTVPAASSDPLTTQASSSWNASVEYFCRRSLDISSPLRSRFRELVVGSVGRAGGLKSP